MLQFIQNAVPVHIHEFFRSVLPGQHKFFQNLHPYRRSGKDLGFNCFFCFINVFFADEFFTGNVNSQQIFGSGHGYFRNLHLTKQSLEAFA